MILPGHRKRLLKPIRIISMTCPTYKHYQNYWAKQLGRPLPFPEEDMHPKLTPRLSEKEREKRADWLWIIGMTISVLGGIGSALLIILLMLS